MGRADPEPGQHGGSRACGGNANIARGPQVFHNTESEGAHGPPVRQSPTMACPIGSPRVGVCTRVVLVALSRGVGMASAVSWWKPWDFACFSLRGQLVAAE